MATQKTLQLVARLPSSMMAPLGTGDGSASGKSIVAGGCRSFVISHLKPIVIEPPPTRPGDQNGSSGSSNGGNNSGHQHHQQRVVLLDSDESSDYESSANGSAADGCPRKRARLTNLTNEEKILRRKLKNRVSAQTARDRKKQRMAELEEAIMSLQQKNKMLEAENHALKSRTESLTKENKDLRQQLKGSSVMSPETQKPAVIIEPSKPQVIHVQKKRKLDADSSSLSSSQVIDKDIRLVTMPSLSADSSRPTVALPKVVSISGMQRIVGKKALVGAGTQVPRMAIIGSDTSSGKQPCESAALTRLSPPQQELLCLMAFQLVAVIFFAHWMSVGITASMAFLKRGSNAENNIKSTLDSSEIVSSKRRLRRLRRWEKRPSTLKRWWGRHQRNWNPSMNS